MPQATHKDIRMKIRMKKGFMLIEVMIAIVMAGVIAAVLATMGYYIMIQSNTLKYQNTKTILDVIRSRLVNSATDPDSDSYFELLKQEANSTVPAVAGLGKDAWGRNITYTTYDFGTHNGVNPLYADTNTSISPNTNVLGRLVSSGEDGILNTNSSHTAAQGDDLMIEIGIGETNHLKLYGGSEITTQTRGYNSAIVSPSGTPPTSPITGTLWFQSDTNLTKVWNGTAWI